MPTIVNQPPEIGPVRRLFAVTLDRILYPALVWMGARSEKRRFEPGERALAIDAERGKEGRSWLATNRAVYIVEMASPENRRRGVVYGTRIRYSRIACLREERVGRVLVRNLQLRDPLGGGYSGQFVEGRAKLTAVIQSHLLPPDEAE